MGFFESLFYTIWRGIAIGILISAPMGPVGIMCIQRTLYKGRKAGLYTGIGAAISDLFYCILTGFGLSFIEEFLERNQNIIQLAGSAVLIAFAVYLFKKNPASSLKTPQEGETQVSPHKNILGGFLFTFSNPLILFLIIGLFARFNFSIPEISFYYYIAGYVAIFVGAVIWWEFVTFSVNKLRAHFNLRSMWLINRIIGVIILLFALVGIITGVTNLASAETIYWNKGRSYLPFRNATVDGVILDNLSDSIMLENLPLQSPAEEFNLRFRARNVNGHPSKKYPYTSVKNETLYAKNPAWGFYMTSGNDTLLIKIRTVEKEALPESMPALEVSVNSTFDLKPEVIYLTKNINPFSGDNLWEVINNSGKLEVWAGAQSLTRIYEAMAFPHTDGFSFFAAPGDKVLLSDIELTTAEDYKSLSKNFDINDLDIYLKGSDDPLEGYWILFDRELQETLLKMGGEYHLACVKEGALYNMIYLQGARINGGNWAPGDIKLTLKPTPFPGIYDVIWVDAMKEVMDKELKAQTGEGNTLQIQFPYQASKLRLRKLPVTASAATSGTTASKATAETATAATSRP